MFTAKVAGMASLQERPDRARIGRKVDEHMSNFELTDLLTEASERMTLALRHRLVPHPGERGTDREEVIRQFLREHLPKRFHVSTGFVVDCHGNVSEQVDVVIADSLTCPRFETAGGTEFFPCESVVAAGQVKSQLTSRHEFRNAIENLDSVKQLDRSGHGRATCSKTGDPIDQHANHLHQVFGFVFITGKALSSETASDELKDFIWRKEPDRWPNIIMAMDRYLITYCCDGGHCPNPMHARGISVTEGTDSADLLMKFYLFLAQAINVTATANVPFHSYLASVFNFPTSTVEVSTWDDPPPLLCQLPGRP